MLLCNNTIYKVYANRWQILVLSLALCYFVLVFSVLLVLQLPRLGKRELILVLFIHLFDSCLFGFVSSSSLCLRRAAACDCGAPWTFLLPFFSMYFDIFCNMVFLLTCCIYSKYSDLTILILNYYASILVHVDSSKNCYISRKQCRSWSDIAWSVAHYDDDIFCPPVNCIVTSESVSGQRMSLSAWQLLRFIWSSITKTLLFKYIGSLQPKKENCSNKNSGIFHIPAQIIECGYSLEPPRRGGSNEYPQSMFLAKQEK